MKHLKTATIGLIFIIGLGSEPLQKGKHIHSKDPVAFDLANLNTDVQPCDNFYAYAIGNWQKLNPIPPTEGRWMSFNVLAEENRTKIQGILNEALQASNPSKGSDLQLIQDFYKSALDTQSREERGYEPLRPTLETIDQINDEMKLNHAFASLRRMRVSTPVSLYVSVDAENSNEHIVGAGQSGLTLGDKSYYLRTEDKYVDIRDKYKEHIDEIFRIAGMDANNAGARILELETKLAEISWDRKDLRDADKTYNRMIVEEFDQTLVNLQIKEMLNVMGLAHAEEIVVGPVSYYTELDKLM